MMAAHNSKNIPGEIVTSKNGSIPSGHCEQHESYEIGCVDCAEKDIKLCEYRIVYLDKKAESIDSTTKKYSKLMEKIDGYYSVIRSHEEFIEKQRIENHPLLNIPPEFVDLWTKDFDQGSFGTKLHVCTPFEVDERGFEVSELDYELAEIEIESDDKFIHSHLLSDALRGLLEEDDVQERIKTKFFELLKEKLEE